MNHFRYVFFSEKSLLECLHLLPLFSALPVLHFPINSIRVGVAEALGTAVLQVESKFSTFPQAINGGERLMS